MWCLLVTPYLLTYVRTLLYYSTCEGKGAMVIVQGKVQGDTAADSFVNLWGGLMGSKPATKGVSRVQRVQGALGGILKEIGFTADQVFLI